MKNKKSTEKKPDFWRVENLDNREETFYKNISVLCRYTKISTSTFYYNYDKEVGFVIIGKLLIKPIFLSK